MLQKILIPIIFLAAQFIISWYGYFTGKLSTKGTYLGISYDSIFIRSLLVQLEYIWVFIIINFLFSVGFQLGFTSYKNYIVLVFIWIAAGPIAALIVNSIFAKESLDLPLIIGIILIVLGGISVVAHKEIAEWL